VHHLSRSEADEVLLALADNPSCPGPVLQNLLQRRWPREIAQKVANNPNLPKAALAMWQLARH